MLRDSSHKNYMKHYHGIYQFAAMVGDHETLLLLNENFLGTFAASMKPETISMYILSKTGVIGQPLKVG